jgi:hypothetical protein
MACRRNLRLPGRRLCHACALDHDAPPRPSPSKYAPFDYRDMSLWPLPRCAVCGVERWVNLYHGRVHPVCSTCRRRPAERAVIRERIAVYERRAAAGRPLFGAA